MLADYPRLYNGGVSRVVIETSRALQRRGYSVGLTHHFAAESVEIDGPSWKLPDTLPDPVGTRPEMLAVFQRIFDSFQPDLIHAHTRRASHVLDFLLGHAPMCQFIHDQSYYCGGGHRMVRGHRPCHRAHGWMCLVHNYLQGCGGRNPRNNWLWWKGTEFFQPVKRHPTIRLQAASRLVQQGLEENGFPSDRIDLIPLASEPATLPDLREPGRILIPGRLAREKGVHVALDALAPLKDLPWRLSMPGQGPELEPLRRRAAEMGLAERLELPGEIDAAAMEREYARCDLVVFPVLRFEPFGLIGTEALAHGKPIVAFGGGGVEEWLADGESGLRVSERTPTALGAAIRRVLTEPGLRDRLAAGAVRRYPQFHPDAYLDRLERSYERTRAGWLRARAG